MTRSDVDPDRLNEGAREVRWAPRVPLHKIRRLYETDALGIVDEEQIDDVGYALLARCQSVLEATEAHDTGRLRCPRCRSAIQRRGRPDRPEGDAEVIRCGACGWATTGGAYRRTYRARQLFGRFAVPAFEAFVRDFEHAATPQQKMLAIDRLVHAIHGDVAQGYVGRPAGVNVLQGTIREIFTLLDDLAYGQGTTPGLLDGRAAWQTTKRAAARLSTTWRFHEAARLDQLDQDAPVKRLAARAEQIATPHGSCRLLATIVDSTVAPTMPDLRAVADTVRAALGHPQVLVLACRPVDGGGPHCVAFVSPELAERGLRADGLVKRLTRCIGGGGGGSAHEAFGGGGDSSLLEAAIDQLRQAVRHALEVDAGLDAATEGAATP